MTDGLICNLCNPLCHVRWHLKNGFSFSYADGQSKFLFHGRSYSTLLCTLPMYSPNQTDFTCLSGTTAEIKQSCTKNEINIISNSIGPPLPPPLLPLALFHLLRHHHIQAAGLHSPTVGGSAVASCASIQFRTALCVRVRS